MFILLQKEHLKQVITVKTINLFSSSSTLKYTIQTHTPCWFAKIFTLANQQKKQAQLKLCPPCEPTSGSETLGTPEASLSYIFMPWNRWR